MKQKKRRRAKRTVEFYTIQGSFREPYQVMLDGNFLHLALTSGIGDLHSRLGDLLGSSPKKTPKLFITSCVMHELQSMGLQESWSWANEHCIPYQCSHHEPITPDQCISDIVESAKTRSYFIASQDSKLHGILGQHLNIGTITLSVNGVHLLPPTEAQQNLAKESLNADMKSGKRESELDQPNENKEASESRGKPYSKLRQKQHSRANQRTAVMGQGSVKKKRPGPRLRNALKAQAAVQNHEASVIGSEDAGVQTKVSGPGKQDGGHPEGTKSTTHGNRPAPALIAVKGKTPTDCSPSEDPILNSKLQTRRRKKRKKGAGNSV